MTRISKEQYERNELRRLAEEKKNLSVSEQYYEEWKENRDSDDELMEDLFNSVC